MHHNEFDNILLPRPPARRGQRSTRSLVNLLLALVVVHVVLHVAVRQGCNLLKHQVDQHLIEDRIVRATQSLMSSANVLAERGMVRIASPVAAFASQGVISLHVLHLDADTLEELVTTQAALQVSIAGVHHQMLSHLRKRRLFDATEWTENAMEVVAVVLVKVEHSRLVHQVQQSMTLKFLLVRVTIATLVAANQIAAIDAATIPHQVRTTERERHRVGGFSVLEQVLCAVEALLAQAAPMSRQLNVEHIVLRFFLDWKDSRRDVTIVGRRIRRRRIADARHSRRMASRSGQGVVATGTRGANGFQRRVLSHGVVRQWTLVLGRRHRHHACTILQKRTKGRSALQTIGRLSADASVGVGRISGRLL